MEDKFGRKIEVLRISITDKCNFSCLHCSREFNKLEKKYILSFEEIINIVKIFTNIGIRKIKITGGEPLIRKDVYYLLKEISNIQGIEEISLTTNGFYLFENIEKIRNAGVKRINISLNTLNEEKFKKITGIECLERIKKVIKESSKFFHPVKVNVVVMKSINFDEIIDFFNFSIENNVYLKFIELMPVYKNISFWRENFVSYRTIKNILEKYTLLYQVDENKRVKSYRSFKDSILIEFVSPVSEPFCKKCNRLRIDCKGNLFFCLYGKPVLNLRSFDKDILSSISSCIYNRDFSFNPFIKFPIRNFKLPIMNFLGG